MTNISLGSNVLSLSDHTDTQDPQEFHELKWLHANHAEELLMEHGFAKCIFPKRNRLVLIHPDAYHMVTRVNEAAGDNVRMSLAGFFHKTNPLAVNEQKRKGDF